MSKCLVAMPDVWRSGRRVRWRCPIRLPDLGRLACSRRASSVRNSVCP